MSVFTIERIFELFWTLVQIICFSCVKYAHDDIAFGTGRGVRIAAVGGMTVLVLATASFLPELGFYAPLRWDVGGVEYYAWAVRMSLCAAMMFFDLMIVLYFYRITRLYKKGLSAARGTFLVDVAVFTLFVVSAGVYICASTSASVRLGFSWMEYRWVGRFFVEMANFFYLALESAGAVLLWKFLAYLKEERGND